jgi:hypothetical protein
VRSTAKERHHDVGFVWYPCFFGIWFSAHFGFPLIDEIHRRRTRRAAAIPARDVAYGATRE